MEDVLQISGFVAALWLAGGLAERLKCPALIGELLAGMALGPHGAKLLRPEMASSLQTAGSVGLLLMVTEGGLSMELAVLRSQGVRATVLALTGTILPVLFGWAFMLALGYDSVAAIASGTALSSTAIGFTLRLMSDLKMLDTAQGQLITAAAMLDDVFSLILLAMLQALVGQGSADLAWAVARPLLGSAGAFAASLAIGYGLLKADAALGRAAQRDAAASPSSAPSICARARAALLEQQTTVAALLGICVAFAWCASSMYSSSLLGAFLAGCLFCGMPRASQAWDEVAPVQAWLSRIFFGATVGFTVPVDALLQWSSLGDGLFLTVAAILGKFLSGAWAAPVRRQHPSGPAFWTSWLQVGCAMIGRGELGFVLAAEGLAAGILPPRAYVATVWALVLATLLGPIAFRASLQCGSCRRRGPTTSSETAGATTSSTSVPVVAAVVKADDSARDESV